MRKYLPIAIGVLYGTPPNGDNSPFLLNSMNKQPVFAQNRGQVFDARGNPVPKVLAQPSVPGLCTQALQKDWRDFIPIENSQADHAQLPRSFYGLNTAWDNIG